MAAESAGLEQRHAVKEVFDDRFAEHGLTLPPASVRHAMLGWSTESGWRAAFRWLRARGGWELEVAAEHRMTDPFHLKITAEAGVIELDAMHDFAQPTVEPEVAAAIRRAGNYNDGIRSVLERRGLYPWTAIEERALRWQSLGINPHAVFADASIVAGDTIDPLQPKASFLERKLEDALRAALERGVPRSRIGARSGRHVVPGWTDRLGGLDLFVEDDVGELLIAAELKVDDVEWVLWDLLKLSNLFEATKFQAAFLAVAAPQRAWDSHREGADLFPAQGVCLIWDTRRLVHAWRRSWTDALSDGAARPLYCPDRIEIETLAVTPVAAYSGYELRVASIFRPIPLRASASPTAGQAGAEPPADATAECPRTLDHDSGGRTTTQSSQWPCRDLDHRGSTRMKALVRLDSRRPELMPASQESMRRRGPLRKLGSVATQVLAPRYTAARKGASEPRPRPVRKSCARECGRRCCRPGSELADA